MIAKEMKASELDKGLKIAIDPSDDESSSYYIPPQKVLVVETYSKVGMQYDRVVNDRAWDWWVNIVVTPDPVKNQEIKRVIPQLYRTKDHEGKEWLFYNVDMIGNDWKGNRKDFSYIEGVIEGIPVFSYEIDPSTQKVIAGTTQVLEVTKKYTIPFTKAKVEELSESKDYTLANPLSCIIIAEDRRKYSCSLDEFRDMPYNELVKEKTGMNEYFRNKRGSKVYS